MGELVKLTINGIPVQAPNGALLIDVAKREGIEIPAFCYYEGLSLQAAWTTLVAAKLVGAVDGLGTILNQGAQDIYPAMILVGMASVALCGWAMTQALGWIEHRVMPWKA